MVVQLVLLHARLAGEASTSGSGRTDRHGQKSPTRSRQSFSACKTAEGTNTYLHRREPRRLVVRDKPTAPCELPTAGLKRGWSTSWSSKLTRASCDAITGGRTIGGEGPAQEHKKSGYTDRLRSPSTGSSGCPARKAPAKADNARRNQHRTENGVGYDA